MSDSDIRIHGYVAPGYESVRDAFAANVHSGLDVGATFAVYRDGEALVDLWGGHVDEARSAAVSEDTLFNIWSTTKGLAATCVALLVDRGLIDYETPVARYWPEFGAAGKADISVAQMMSHQAGLVGPREPTTLEDYFAHDELAERLAGQRPLFGPGKWGYHTLSFGTLADELVRRVDGRRIGAFFADEIAGKLGLDLHMGLSEQDDHRQAHTIVPPDVANARFFDPYDPACLNVALNPMLDWSWPNRRDWRANGLAGAGGSANARGLAKLYDFLANDGTAGNVSLLSADTVRQASAERVAGADQCSGGMARYAAGYRLNTGTLGASPFAFGHMGLGGSAAFADPARKLGVAYAMNKLFNPHWQWVDPRFGALLVALYGV